MKASSRADDEGRRLEALARYEVLDTPPERALDELTALAADICGAPIALVSLLDAHREWFKSRFGWLATEAPREASLFAHARNRAEMFIVPDTAEDERFVDSPLVIGEPRIRFYAGAPLVTPGGHVLGALCVIDHVPRRLTDSQVHALGVLSREVMARMELHRRTRSLAARERLLQGIIDSEPECVKVVGEDGTLRMMNPAGLRMIEADSFEQVAHRSLLPLIAPDHRAAFRDLTESVLGGGSGRLEFRIVSLKGNSRWLETHATPLRNERGEPTSLLGVTRDVTERRRSAQALVQSEARLRLALEAAHMASSSGMYEKARSSGLTGTRPFGASSQASSTALTRRSPSACIPRISRVSKRKPLAASRRANRLPGSSASCGRTGACTGCRDAVSSGSTTTVSPP